VRLLISLLGLCISMSYRDSDIQALTPPFQSIKEIAIQRTQRRDVKDSDPGRPFDLLQQSTEDW